MTETTTSASKIIPNSFQTPNFFVDECMPLLTGNEYKCLSFVARKTFGWQKRSDRISKSQIMAATGLANETVDKTMSILVDFGLVLRISENNPHNAGTEWALQTDESLVHFELMLARQEKEAEAKRLKTEKGRKKLAEKRIRMAIEGGLSNNPPSETMSVEQKTRRGGIVEQMGGEIVGQLGGGSVGQSPQKPIKTKEKMGANAPVTPIKKTKNKNVPPNVGGNAPETSAETSDLLEARIVAFPEETLETVRLMLELFGVRPPERPIPGEKGGEYALWIKGIRQLQAVAADYGIPLEKALRQTYQRWQNKPFDVSHPGALKKSLTSVLAQQARAQTQTEISASSAEETSTGPATLPSNELRARMEALRNQRKN